MRDYQIDQIEEARRLIRRKVRRILLQAPTGAGKTALATNMIAGTVMGGANAWFICHRNELLEGTSNTFRKYGIHHGFIASGLPVLQDMPVQICSIDTLKNRLAVLNPPKVAIIDECHHCSAAGWAMVIEWLHQGGAIIIGLSATPTRLDGQPLDAHFDEMVLGPKVAWLIEQGFLSRYDIYAPSRPDMSGVSKRLGDYARGESAQRINKAKLIGDAVDHWQRLAGGVKSIGFAVHVEHSMHCVKLFQAAGVRAAHLDGNTPKGERRRIIQDYASDRLDMIFNCGLFGEGFDLAAIAQRDVTIDCVVDMAPTMSLSNYLQRGGRMLRPSPGKLGLYFDHAGNSDRHGFFDDDREWSLEGKESAGKGREYAPPPPVTCPKCFKQMRQPVPDKCVCGHVLRSEAAPLEVEAGELEKRTENDKREIRARLKAEQDEAKTLDALVSLGRKRGHRFPQKWAMDVISSRSPPPAANHAAPKVTFNADAF